MGGAFCFALIFGGTIRSALAAAAAGFIVSGYLLLCEKKGLSSGFRKISAAALITLVCILGCHLLDTEASHAIIGTLMIEPLMHMDLGDLTVALPAFLCVAMQPFSYNIAYGILFGLLSYAIVTIAAKRTKEIKATTWVLIVLFAAYFVFDVLL